MLSIAPFWLWLVGALALMALETLAPGIFLFWMGLAALATAFLLMAVPMGWVGQLIAFAVFGLVAVLGGLWFQRRQRHEATDAPFLNQRGAALVGRTVVLHSPIKDGSGQAKIDDTVWRVHGPDLPKGASVRIIAAEGARLTVEAA
jgi:hypothetical protein